MGLIGIEWNGLERNGTEWNAMECNGAEQNGREWTVTDWEDKWKRMQQIGMYYDVMRCDAM